MGYATTTNSAVDGDINITATGSIIVLALPEQPEAEISLTADGDIILIADLLTGTGDTGGTVRLDAGGSIVGSGQIVMFIGRPFCLCRYGI